MSANGSQVAIVTSATSSIGIAISQRLAADGMAVAVVDQDQPACEAVAAAINHEGGGALAVAANVNDAEQVNDAVKRITETLGQPLVLINNAEVIRGNISPEAHQEGDREQALARSYLRGPFLLCRAVRDGMIRRKYGRIVNVTSSWAFPFDDLSKSSAAIADPQISEIPISSNTGIGAFTRSLSVDLGRFGVTANAVSPGFVMTDLAKATASRFGVDSEEFQERAISQIAVGRIGQPEDVAHAVAFLASEGAGFISGQVIYVSGGPSLKHISDLRSFDQWGNYVGC